METNGPVTANLISGPIRLNMTEKLFTGTLNHNQNKTKTNISGPSISTTHTKHDYKS